MVGVVVEECGGVGVRVCAHARVHAHACVFVYIHANARVHTHTQVFLHWADFLLVLCEREASAHSWC